MFNCHLHTLGEAPKNSPGPTSLESPDRGEGGIECGDVSFSLATQTSQENRHLLIFPILFEGNVWGPYFETPYTR